MNRHSILLPAVSGAFTALCLALAGVFTIESRAIGVPGTFFVVNSIADDSDSDLSDDLCNTSEGMCTLRAAIEQANATANTDAVTPDEIHFEIAGPGVHTIRPHSSLPDIADAVLIDGYTHGGASANTMADGSDAVLLIEIDGSLAAGFIFGLTLKSSGSTIRGLVVNRFGGANILLDGANENHIEGNFIGTDATGTIARPNGADGIVLFGSASNVIGGASPDKRNVISGNTWSGVAILNGLSQANIVEGNYIGTDPSGLNDVGNGRNGVLISALVGVNDYATMNRIGGVGTGKGNLISGNGWSGVQVFRGTRNEILGNLIGTTVDGKSRLPNQNDGVLLNEASNNLVGGQFADDGSGAIAAYGRNIISGNNGRGVDIFVGSQPADGNLVVGNYIGTDISGLQPVPNTSGGVILGSGVGATAAVTNNIIGGTDAAHATRNIISGNGSSGVVLAGPMVTNNQIVGNFIGLSLSGASELGNTLDGVRFTTFGSQSAGPTDNFIGTSAANSGNVISGNGRDGVAIAFGSAGNSVLNNYIGLDHLGTGTASGAAPGDGDGFGNTRHGVFIANDSSNNTIGAVVNDMGNVIAFNGMNGVTVESGTGNAIRGNQIFENGGLGIDLGADGFTENDPADADAGANELQNFPTVVVQGGNGTTSLTLNMDTALNTIYLFDIYTDDASNDVFATQGRTYLMTLASTGGNTDQYNITTAVPGSHRNFSVTATDPVGNTSEFGREQLVHSVEFTQAIQTFQPLDEFQTMLADTGEPPVPMIAGKPGVARVYLRQLMDETDVNIEFAGLDVGFVSNELLRASPGCTPEERRRGESHGPLSMSRKCLSMDFYFCDPPQGQWDTTLTVLSPSGDVFERHRFRQVTRTAKTLVLNAVQICHDIDANGRDVCGNDKVLRPNIGLLRSIAPTHEVRVEEPFYSVRRRLTTQNIDGSNGLTGHVGDQYEEDIWDDTVLHDLADFHAWFNAAPSPLVQVHYFGITGAMGVPAGMACIGGFGAFGQENVTRFRSTQETETNFETYAHETGHMLGRLHTNLGHVGTGPPPGCYGLAFDPDTDWPYCDSTIQSGSGAAACLGNPTPEVGFDVAGRHPLMPETTFDIMSYCNPRWISPFTYRTIADNGLAPKTTPALGQTASGTPPVTGQFWLVSGEVGNGAVTFLPLRQIETKGLDALGEGSYRIEIRDSSEIVLSTRFFEPMTIIKEDVNQGVVIPPYFSELMVVQVGASSIVVLDVSDVELGRITLGGVVPSVTVDFAPGAASLSGLQTIGWTIVDPDSAEHAVTVQYSNDNGLIWHNVASFEAASEFDLDFDTLPGADGSGIIRVYATDGVNTGFGDSAPFSVATKLPQVEIFFPADGTVFRRGELVWLQASASDGDDGSLNDSAIVWTSNLDGDIGQGGDLPITSLGVGVHTITVTATDTDGNMVTDSITITVEDSLLIETTAVIHVPADQPTIQAAIDVSRNGDEIIVAPGTYDEIIDFHGKAITLRSSGGADATIIDATNVADPGDGKPVVRCDSGEGPNTVLDGFTITGGTGDTGLSGAAFTRGGGMFNNGSSPMVTNCTFDGNAVSFEGGGMANIVSSPTVTNCTFDGNSAQTGGGMSNIPTSDPIVTNCVFSGNTAERTGGGIFNNSSSPTVTNCIFNGNAAELGGGMYTFFGTPTVTNCMFTGNAALSDGGGMMNRLCSPTVTGCTFGGNTALSDGGGMQNFDTSNPAITNCIFWMNSDLGGTDESGQIHNDDTLGPNSPTVNFSNIQGGWTGIGGAGNINVDPQFMDADGPDNQVGTADDDLRLQPGSPCIDSGDPAFVANPSETDLDGHVRVLCDRVEMGAYEFAGDFACDQTIDLDDFANWDACMTGPDGGPYAHGCASFDSDADLDIDMQDFAEFSNLFSP